jgi:hypothetical protein
VKIMTKPIEVMFANMPSCLKKFAIEIIRFRCFIKSHTRDNIINFFMNERFDQTFQILY